MVAHRIMKQEKHHIPALTLSFEVKLHGSSRKSGGCGGDNNEAGANAPMCSRAPGPTASRVTVCAGCNPRQELLVCVTDQGEGFDPSALPDPTATGNMHEGHGRGAFLMRRLVDEVEFNLGGRQVILRKQMVRRDTREQVTFSPARSRD